MLCRNHDEAIGVIWGGGGGEYPCNAACGEKAGHQEDSYQKDFPLLFQKPARQPARAGGGQLEFLKTKRREIGKNICLTIMLISGMEEITLSVS
jgi:hypothetical protein